MSDYPLPRKSVQFTVCGVVSRIICAYKAGIAVVGVFERVYDRKYRLPPSSVITVSYPLGRRLIKLWAWADFAAAVTSSSDASGLPTPDGENAKELTAARGNVKLENVYFSYVPDKKLIENFNLEVKPGQRVAIVGLLYCLLPGKSLHYLLVADHLLDQGCLLPAHAYGDIVSRVVADVDTFADGLLMGFTQLFTGVLTILLCRSLS